MENIYKNDFDAALMQNIRQDTVSVYNEMFPIQNKIARKAEKILRNNKLLNSRDCPICEKKTEEHPLDSKYFHGINLILCKRCYFLYAATVLTGDYNKNLYKSDDENFHKIYLSLKNTPNYTEIEKKKSKYIIQILNKFISLRGTILDIGSGAGSIISAAEDDGWIATGIEANPLFYNHAKSKGLDVIPGFFPEVFQNKSGNIYHVISILDVLEHQERPIEFLLSIKKYLSNEGLLVIQVPNFNSLYIRLDGPKNNNFCIGHWSYFTPQTLNNVMEKAGFENLFLETYISEFDKIQQFHETKIQNVIKELTGKSLNNLNELTIDWLHENLLGYKIFGVYRLK